MDKIEIQVCRKDNEPLAGNCPSQSVGDVEEVIDVSSWVMLQQLDIGSEVPSQQPLPD
jgi:hypothetical protein